MATPVTHAVAALAIGAPWYRREIPKRIWVAAAICSAVPDLDAIGFRYGIRYQDFWGHRGFTHSLVFAALLSVVVTLILRHTAGFTRLWMFLYFFAATASHGVLDAMTNGGLGVAFFSPFDTQRYFLSWRPIRVSPITFSKFVTRRELAILLTEVWWVWLPSIVFAAAILLLRKRLGRSSAASANAVGAGNRT